MGRRRSTFLKAWKRRRNECGCELSEECFLEARKSEAERPAGCAFLLRVPFGKHFQKTGAGKQTGGTRWRWGDMAIASLRGVPAERSDKKCALRGQRRRQFYLSRREISSPNGLIANSGVGRTSFVCVRL